MFEPVERRSVTDAVFDQIRDLILGGEVEPGAKLPAERELAQQLGVNRNVVREALQRLAQLRLVTIQPGGATRVLDFRTHAGLDLIAFLIFGGGSEPRLDAVRSMIELRTALGPDIAARAAERRKDDVPARVWAIVEAMAEKPDAAPIDLERQSLALWRVLVEASDNVCYELLLNTLERAHAGVAGLVALAIEPELRDVASYRALARAIEAKDGKAARRAAERLLARGEAGALSALSAAGGGAKEAR